MKLSLLVFALILLGGSVNASDPQHSSQRGWPCDRKIDPTYIQVTEATGGQVPMFDPSEARGSLTLIESQLHANEETV